VQRSWRILITTTSLTILIIVSFGVGVWAAPAVRGVVGAPDVGSPGVGQQFQVFWQVWNIVMDNYVDRSKINAQQMTYGAIRGMLTTLDDPGHTRFLTSADYTDQENHLQGRFTGIGVVLTVRNGDVTIQEVYPDSPASQAGMQIGDVIVAINGKPASGMTSDAAARAMSGPRGSSVQLDVRHAGETTARSLTLIRADIHLTSVRWQMLPGTSIADIAISEFNQGTTQGVRTALTSAKTQGATGYILDVRNDPGGLLDESVSVSSLFLKSGKVLIQRDAKGHDQAFNVLPGAVDTSDPVVVLINGGTASAAEIFAAAIHDNQRGQLVGSKTDGTGTVLSTYRLLDGSALLLGTAEWLTPNGQSIWKQGISPDISVALPAGVPLATPTTLNFPTNADQVLANSDVVLVRAVQLLQAAEGATGR
jgi:carboxyl-terminal processing protease